MNSNRTKKVYKLRDDVLKIAVDNGFSGNKVIINGEILHYPSDIVRSTPDSLSGLYSQGDDLWDASIVYTEGANCYVVGNGVKQIMKSKKADGGSYNNELDENQAISRFTTDKFFVSVKTAIGLAIDKYVAKYNITNIEKYEIFLSLALPHIEVNDSNKIAITKRLAGQHTFFLTYNGKQQTVNFMIKEDNTAIFSQVICVAMNEILDDYGRELKDAKLKEMLPALFLDIGYRTVGIVLLRENLNVVKGEATSSVKYAMLNVCEEVAKEIMEKYVSKAVLSNGLKEASYTSREVEGYIISGTDTIRHMKYVEKDGKYVRESITINVKDIFVKKVIETVNDMAIDIDINFNQLKDVNHIMVAGGAGETFFPYIQQQYNPFFGATKNEENEAVTLSRATFNDMVQKPVYSIVIGAYKFLQLKYKDRLRVEVTEQAS